MRVNYSNWPAIQVLDHERCAEYIRNDEEHFFCAFNASNKLSEAEAYAMEGMTYMNIYNGQFAGTKLYYVSKTFFKALEKSAVALYKMLGSKEECEKVHEDCAFIMDDMLWVIKTQPNGFVRLMRIVKSGCLFTSFAYKIEGDNRFSSYDSTTTPDCERSCVALYYMLMLLKRYGQAEVEVITKNKKVMSKVLNEKTINETGMEVQVLDSRWFTAICRDEGFLVSGHFRLQPCKDDEGQWTKKLIYINPYAKHGYHRMAPIVNLNEEGG